MNDRLFAKSLLALGIAAIFLLWLGRYTDIDIMLADRMFDVSKHDFVWRRNWFAVVFMHEAMKIALIAFGLALTAIFIVCSTVLPNFLTNATRRKLGVVVASFVLVPVSISLLKATSIHACPWDLKRYGGGAPYLRLLDALPVDVVAGHCFPAGHASSALWLAAFAVFWLPWRPQKAAVVFAIGLVPGGALGWVQQMRGAHFLTHTLWSMWLTGLIIAVAARLLYSPANGEKAANEKICQRV